MSGLDPWPWPPSALGSCGVSGLGGGHVFDRAWGWLVATAALDTINSGATRDALARRGFPGLRPRIIILSADGLLL